MQNTSIGRANRGCRPGILACAIAVVLIAGPVQAQAQSPAASAQASFNIPAQSAGEALNAFARQSGWRILFPYDAVEGKRTRAVHGAMSSEAALQQLLADTGLIVASRENGVITLCVGEEGGCAGKNAALPPLSNRSSVPLRETGQLAEARTTQTGGSQQASTTARAEVTELDRMIVVGTNIRGSGPIGSNTLVLTREDLLETGYATVEDYLKTIPQNFAATQPEVLGGLGNFNRGIGANLRGLGSGATLTLVNGRRQATGGDGDFVDVAAIPSNAVKRIEILPDGASAIYGSDAIAGVMNIVLRDDFEGAELSGRYGYADGSRETQASATFGRAWDRGNFLVGYQLHERDPLASADRIYAEDADKRPFGGNDFRNQYSNPGNILSPTTLQPAYAIPEGQDGTNLTVTDLLPGATNMQGSLEGTDLLPKNDSQAAYGLLRHQLTDNFEIFSEARWSERKFLSRSASALSILTVPSTNPFYVNPFPGDSVRISYSFLDDLGPTMLSGKTTTGAAVLGGTYSFRTAWEISGYGSYGKQEFTFSQTNTVDAAQLAIALADPNPATAFNPFGDGSHTNPDTLERLRSTTYNDGLSVVRTVNVVADGPLFALGGGEIRAAIGAEWREEEIESTRTRANLSRVVRAAFAELSVPLVSSANAIRGIRRLEMSIAGRFEDYDDFGNTFNPKYGLSYSPVDELTLRATWGTSFRAPRLYDLSPLSSGGTPAVRLAALPDPQSQTNSTVALIQTGNNGDLSEETATAKTFGVDFAPRELLGGFAASATYYDIDYSDRIQRPGPNSEPDILRQEDLWLEIVNRQPSPDLISALCAQLTSGNCALSPPQVVVDRRLRNIARLRIRGLDLQFSKLIETEVGNFNLGLNASKMFSYEQQLSATSPGQEFVGTYQNPADLRLRGTAVFTRGRVSVSGAANYVDSYSDEVSVPNRDIASWTTFDIGFAYQLGGRAEGVQIALRSVNVFDRDPPFVNNAFGFDPWNASPLGRLVTLQLTKTW